jgi:hypothetical protein
MGKGDIKDGEDRECIQNESLEYLLLNTGVDGWITLRWILQRMI